MELRSLFLLNVPISGFFGFMTLFFPNWFFSLYGVELTPPGIFMTQLAGAAYLGFGILAFLASSSESKDFRLALALGLFVQDLIGTVVSLFGQISGIFNPLGWSSVVIYLLLALGYGYFLFVNKEAT